MTSTNDIPDVRLPGADVSVVILTFNEEVNIAECLRSCSWSDDVHVLDSGSTDRTAELARSMGATVHVNCFESFGQQRNWAIDHIECKHDWVFHLDADERFTPELVQEMTRVVRLAPADAGYFVASKLMFMGRWLRFAAGLRPVYQMRFFHRERMRFCDHGHGQREQTTGVVGRLRSKYLHFNFSKGLEEWIDKHNRYSTREAAQILARAPADGPGMRALFLGSAIDRRRYLKSRVYPALPGKWILRFFWSYFFNLGILDGLPGLRYALLISSYELFISLKVAELKSRPHAP